jgi:ABC-2 type transport system ATP-binding protein
MREVIVRTSKLSRRFGSSLAVNQVELELLAGQIFGLVGPDGAGKTTLIRMIAGMIRPTEGSVELQGKEPSSSACRHLLGYMPQQYSLYGDLSIQENLEFFSEMFGIDSRQFQDRSKRLLEMTRLDRFRERRADALSGGMYKKLALACSLLHRPRLLILDEPTNGVDPVSRREFWDLLGELSNDGISVLVSTPYMDEAALCHRVGLMHHGKILDEGAPATLLSGFPHEVFRVQGSDRDSVGRELGQDAGVLALSPSGSRLRIVIRQGHSDRISSTLSRIGATLVSTAPDFEDLFLARIADETRTEDHEG